MLGATKASCDSILGQIDTTNHSNYKTPAQNIGNPGLVKYNEQGPAGMPKSPIGTPSFSGITGEDVFSGYGAGAGTDFISTAKSFIVDEGAGTLESVFGIPEGSIDFEAFSLPDDLEANLGLEGVSFDSIQDQVQDIADSIKDGIAGGIDSLTDAALESAGGIPNDFVAPTNPLLPMKLKMLAKSPLLIVKGLVEQSDPNIILSKKIYDAAVLAQTVVKLTVKPDLKIYKPPMAAISLSLLPSMIPYGIGFPPPPFGPGVGPPMTPLAVPYLAFSLQDDDLLAGASFPVPDFGIGNLVKGFSQKNTVATATKSLENIMKQKKKSPKEIEKAKIILDEIVASDDVAMDIVGDKSDNDCE